MGRGKRTSCFLSQRIKAKKGDAAGIRTPRVRVKKGGRGIQLEQTGSYCGSKNGQAWVEHYKEHVVGWGREGALHTGRKKKRGDIFADIVEGTRRHTLLLREDLQGLFPSARVWASIRLGEQGRGTEATPPCQSGRDRSSEHTTEGIWGGVLPIF